MSEQIAVWTERLSKNTCDQTDLQDCEGIRTPTRVSCAPYREGRIVLDSPVALYRVMPTQMISRKPAGSSAAMNTTAAPSDEALVESARAGNANDFGELVRRHSREVYGMSFKVLKNREDAEDNLQNAFCKAYGKIQQFEGKSQFSSWLMRIAINEALMMLRKRRLEGVTPCADQETDADDREANPEIRDASADPERQYLTKELASKAVDALQPTLKYTFILQKAEGWTSQELVPASCLSHENAILGEYDLRGSLHIISQGARSDCTGSRVVARACV
jgi:RNA polymerase sigma-70 factor (ECF subfamily)